MSMIDMKMSAEERKEQMQQTDDGMSEYPYGLRICLDDDAIKKLGLTVLPSVGAKVTFTALSVVCSTSAYSSDGKDPETSVSLQITALELIDASMSNESAANALYGKKAE